MNTRKRQVLLASMKLFVEKGFLNTSIQDILDESHISKGTFYNYFSSKNDCLIAILDIGREDATVRKQQLLIGKDLTDKKILAAQIATSMQVNRERNLMPIFESILHSGDPELKKVLQQFHVRELEWLAGRLVHVYGDQMYPYRFDATILLFGMINHLLQLSKITQEDTEACVDPIEMISYAIRQLDAIVPSLIRNKDSFIGPKFERYIYVNSEQVVPEEEDILKQLVGFRHQLKDELNMEECIEYTDCLIEEMTSDNPRYFIIRTVAFKFYDSFRNTKHALEAISIANSVWQMTRLKTADKKSHTPDL